MIVRLGFMETMVNLQKITYRHDTLPKISQSEQIQKTRPVVEATSDPRNTRLRRKSVDLGKYFPPAAAEPESIRDGHEFITVKWKYYIIFT